MACYLGTTEIYLAECPESRWSCTEDQGSEGVLQQRELLGRKKKKKKKRLTCHIFCGFINLRTVGNKQVFKVFELDQWLVS